MKTLVRGLIGVQDMSLGIGTFARTTSSGGTQNLNSVPIALATDGSLLSAKLNGVVYVGGDISAVDLGTQINAAYAALPSTIGKIVVLQKSDSSAYSYSIPIVFGTDGKLVILDLNGNTLQFLPKTGNTALALTSVATTVSGNAVYTGTITGGAANALAGTVFQIAGFVTNTSNNGEFYCTASGATSITLANGYAVSETIASTATPCGNGSSPAAITFNNQTSGSDAYHTMQQLRNGMLRNGTTVANWGPTTTSQAIGINFSGAGSLSLQNIRLCGFAVGRVCLNPLSWGATDVNVCIDSNNTGTIFYNAMEDYRMLGGRIIVNGVGHRTGGNGSAGGASSAFTGVSFDSNNIVGFQQSAGAGETASFLGCHFENFDLTHILTTHYIQTQTCNVSICGGDALDDQSTGSTDFWFKVGIAGGFANLSVHGLQISGNRNPTTAVFVIIGRGFLSGSNAASSVVTNVYATVGNSTVTSFFQNGANNANEAAMEVSGASTFDGNATVTGAVVAPQYLSLGLTVLSSAKTLGNTVTRGIFFLSDPSSGGSGVISVDGTTVTVISTTSSLFAATGSPSSTQIGLTISSSKLLATPGASKVGDAVSFMQFTLWNS